MALSSSAPAALSSKQLRSHFAPISFLLRPPLQTSSRLSANVITLIFIMCSWCWKRTHQHRRPHLHFFSCCETNQKLVMMPFHSDSNISYRQEPGGETLAGGPLQSRSQLTGRTTTSVHNYHQLFQRKGRKTLQLKLFPALSQLCYAANGRERTQHLSVRVPAGLGLERCSRVKLARWKHPAPLTPVTVP